MSEKKKTPGQHFFEIPRLYAERIESLKREIEYLDYLMIPSGIDYSKPSVMTMPVDTLQEYAVHKADLEDDLVRTQKLYIQAVNDVKIVLNLLGQSNPLEAAILSDYYIAHRSWQDIAADHHFSYRHAYKLRDRACRLSVAHIKAVKKAPSGND